MIAKPIKGEAITVVEEVPYIESIERKLMDMTGRNSEAVQLFKRAVRESRGNV